MLMPLNYCVCVRVCACERSLLCAAAEGGVFKVTESLRNDRRAAYVYFMCLFDVLLKLVSFILFYSFFKAV